MKKRSYVVRRGCAMLCGAVVLMTAVLPARASSDQVERRSDGIEITWEDQARTKGYVSKVPSTFSGDNGTWTVPDGVYKIEDEAIEGGTNDKVRQIMLPASFETKEYSASGEDVHDIFDKFVSLTALDVKDGNAHFSALNGVLYSRDTRTIVEYPVGRTSIDLGTYNDNGQQKAPEPTRIGKWAFSGLNLKDFNLPSSVTDYESHALTGLKGVDRMVLPSKPAMLKSYTFEDTGFKEINVPNNIDGKSIAANWIVTDHDMTVTIPDTITSIDDNAIVRKNDNVKVTVRAPKGSAGEDYVKKMNNSNITYEETQASSNSSSSASTGSSASGSGKKAEINNQVTNMDQKNKVSARVNGGSATEDNAYTLVVKDSAGNNLKRKITMDSKTSLIAYDLSLVDKDGKEVKDFNNVEVTLPVPSNMDRSKGRIDVVTLNSRDELEELRTSVKQDGDAVTATFVTNHFSEFGIRYVQDSAASSTTSTTSSSAASASTNRASTVATTSTGRGTSGGTSSRSSGSSSDMPRTGDSETYNTILMTMGGLVTVMVMVLLFTHDAKRKR